VKQPTLTPAPSTYARALRTTAAHSGLSGLTHNTGQAGRETALNNLLNRQPHLLRRAHRPTSQADRSDARTGAARAALPRWTYFLFLAVRRVLLVGRLRSAPPRLGGELAKFVAPAAVLLVETGISHPPGSRREGSTRRLLQLAGALSAVCVHVRDVVSVSG
jgi:hypothetical protein